MAKLSPIAACLSLSPLEKATTLWTPWPSSGAGKAVFQEASFTMFSFCFPSLPTAYTSAAVWPRQTEEVNLSTSPGASEVSLNKAFSSKSLYSYLVTDPRESGVDTLAISCNKYDANGKFLLRVRGTF